MLPGAEEPRLSLFSQVRDACSRTLRYSVEMKVVMEKETKTEVEIEIQVVMEIGMEVSVEMERERWKWKLRWTQWCRQRRRVKCRQR